MIWSTMLFLTLAQPEGIFLEFPSETTTRSGYDVRRVNFAVAVRKGWVQRCLLFSDDSSGTQFSLSFCPTNAERLTESEIYL